VKGNWVVRLATAGARKVARVLPRPMQTDLKILRLRSQLALDMRRVRPALPEALRLLDREWPLNRALRSDTEVEAALGRLRALGLRLHGERAKNWDAYRAFAFILSHGSASSAVLDVGSEYYGVVLSWLRRYDYWKLYGCDLVFARPFRSHSIQWSHQDLHNTGYDSRTFDFISCLSVIEHGVDISRYLTEMHRLLKPGGFLITSTDFWCDPIDTRGLYPYGYDMAEMKVFAPADIDQVVEQARATGLTLVGPVDYTCEERVVHWRRVDRRFTFFLFVLQKTTAVEV